MVGADLFLTNRPRGFQGCHITESSFSDVHRITATAMKMYVKKQQSRVIHYRDDKMFNTYFGQEILVEGNGVTWGSQ